MVKTDAWRAGALKLFFLNDAFDLLGDAAGLPGSLGLGSIFISLYASDPGLNPTTQQSENESGYTGYDRVTIARGSAQWLFEDLTSHQLVTNKNQVLFPENTGPPVFITHYGAGCLDFPSDGKLCYKTPFSKPIEVITGMAPKWDVREIGFAEV